MGILGFLPVFNEDIFLQYRPWPEDSDNLFVLHWHEIAASFLFYYGIQQLSPIISRKYFKDYDKLGYKMSLNFDVHVVSMVQSVVSILSVVPMWNHPSWKNRNEDPRSAILLYYPYGGFVGSITIGYFLWDLYICLRHVRMFGVGFLFHAIAALTVFCCSLTPVALPWIPGFLIFELSTPFVNINWFASKMPPGTFPEKLTIINGLLLITVFFCIRILWGFYSAYQILKDFIAVWSEIHKAFPIIIMSLNLIINVLNVTWFYKMLKIAKKHLDSSSATQESKSGKSD